MKIKKIIRSKRKTIGLQVCDDATLIIRAPLGSGDEVIKKVIIRHHRWLENKKKEILSRDLSLTKREFISGEDFLYLGSSYRLKIVPAKDMGKPLSLTDEYFYLREDVSNPKETFIAWYKQAANEKISERVCWYAQLRGFQYHQTKISGAQKRWGSCSHFGSLNFSWRLVMAPLPIVDYVVVHELVHLIEKNHSRSFWNRVQGILPDYKKHKNWLKKNGYLLRL